MCNFHSICVRRDGVIAHLPSNSHSDIIQKYGWTENDQISTLRGKPRFVECEWDGLGPIPPWDDLARFENDDHWTKAQHDAAIAHYTMLQRALKFDQQ